MECHEKFVEECSRHENCGTCPFGDLSDAQIDALPYPATILDQLLEQEEQSEALREFRPKMWPTAAEKENLGISQVTELAIFDIDVECLFQKDEKTFYTPKTNSWQDGIVFKFNRGVPERRCPCIAVMKWDIRKKYHDFVAGKPRTKGRGMPSSYGKYENGQMFYGIRPVVHIYPATRPDDAEKAGDHRLVLVDWATRKTTRGGQSFGELNGRIISSISGSEQSREGYHGRMWICAVVAGPATTKRTRIANDTCNIRVAEEMA
jgi:hypothetical protein